ncbi:HAD family hydrolase [Clostridium sp. C105KSO13]|uniref:HAD family hydrolase n=1 Tax=Clostridium sp. C105KSO13 TaxID=1776045 RepID=UPI0007407C91|nr:HAD family phosphatase [Clostridium sp. C105KSO13]CUX41188.1 Phosphorylated carbohydrates phosphatase [Clostridium sp. C105KSO13]
MEKFKAAVFDLDGTLLDSMGVWREIDVAFLEKRGITLPDDYVRNITPLGFEAAAQYTIARFGLREDPKEIIREWYDMAKDAYANTVMLKSNVREYLEILKTRDIRIAAATSSDFELVRPALLNNGIFSYFEHIVTVRDVTRGKGHPDIYEEAVSRMNILPADTVVFEDILKGIEGAKAGGFRAVGVYDSYSEYEKDAMIELADHYIYDFGELMEGV